MSFAEIEFELRENKKAQKNIIRGMAKSKNQLATTFKLMQLSTKQEELERKRIEEISNLRISIREKIIGGSDELYQSLPISLRHIVGEVLNGNEELVLAQTINGNEVSLGIEKILMTGLTSNQATFILRQKEQIESLLDCTKKYCDSCKKSLCTSRCPLWALGLWS